MTLRLYNTLTRSVEVFTPLIFNKVGMYVCGPTMYDRIHIGNARPYIIMDILYRLLIRSYSVQYIRNMTDIDDKILEASNHVQCSFSEITKKSIHFFHQNMKDLGILDPTAEPLATDHIPEMIFFIKVLFEKGHAYEKGGHVLFDTASFKDYGKFSNRKNNSNFYEKHRINVEQYKKNLNDFILWKPSDSNQPGWSSPWGFGRPGWHIECSAMSWKHLGVNFDIHAGGQDLIFPHHENEIAQSQGVHGSGTFARYWLHNGILLFNGKKMSKSKENSLKVSSLLSNPGMNGEILRFALLSTHYRKPLNFNENLLRQAKLSLNKLRSFFLQDKLHIKDADNEDLVCPNVLAALEDDLNTPQAITCLHQITQGFSKQSTPSRRIFLRKKLKSSANLLGLLKEEFHNNSSTKGGQKRISRSRIETSIKIREHARKTGNFDLSDSIRNQLLDQGVTLTDLINGTTWRRI